MAADSLCAIPDCCKLRRSSLGWCGMHYARFKRHGDPLGGRTFDGEVPRYYEEVVLNYRGDNCLLWPFSKDPHGYGQMRVDGALVYVHRRVCEDVNGPPQVPTDEAAHSCGKGHIGCVTRGHLSWKTRQQNRDDMLIHGTIARGEASGRAKLTESDVREIRALKGREHQRVTANRFGVSRRAIGAIYRGDSWAWLK